MDRSNIWSNQLKNKGSRHHFIEHWLSVQRVSQPVIAHLISSPSRNRSKIWNLAWPRLQWRPWRLSTWSLFHAFHQRMDTLCRPQTSVNQKSARQTPCLIPLAAERRRNRTLGCWTPHAGDGGHTAFPCWQVGREMTANC